MRVYSEHTEYIGKICKLTAFGLVLEQEYESLFGVGNYQVAQHIFQYCYLNNRYAICLMFIDEPPITRDGVTWYCFKEFGTGCSGDWHWFTLNQVMVCN